MSKTYFAYNGPAVTSAGPVKVTTGTAIKTMLQLATPSTEDLKIVEWGISFDINATVGGVPILCELIDTSVAATVTAFAAADLVKWNQPNDPASLLTVGTTASGYTATAEGTVVATTRQLDTQLVAPTGQYVKQFPLGREPVVPISRFLRIRVTAPVAANCLCYIIWEE